MTMERHAVTFSMRDSLPHHCFLQYRIEPEPSVGTRASADKRIVLNESLSHSCLSVSERTLNRCRSPLRARRTFGDRKATNRRGQPGNFERCFPRQFKPRRRADVTRWQSAQSA